MAQAKGYYDFTIAPSDRDRLCATIHKLLPTSQTPPAFLDFGSGSGKMLAAAEMAGYEPLLGIEQVRSTTTPPPTYDVHFASFEETHNRGEDNDAWWSAKKLALKNRVVLAYMYHGGVYTNQTMKPVLAMIKELATHAACVVVVIVTHWLDADPLIRQDIRGGKYPDADTFAINLEDAGFTWVGCLPDLRESEDRADPTQQAIILCSGEQCLSDGWCKMAAHVTS